MANAFKRGLDARALIEIGKAKSVIQWMEYYGIPFNREDIQHVTDEKGETISFEVMTNKKVMLKDFDDEPGISELVKKGEIIVTFKY